MGSDDVIAGTVAFIGVIVLVTILVGLWGLLWSFPLMWAWNYVMPPMFGLKTITYWQMFSLYFILTSLWKITTVSK